MSLTKKIVVLSIASSALYGLHLASLAKADEPNWRPVRGDAEVAECVTLAQATQPSPTPSVTVAPAPTASATPTPTASPIPGVTASAQEASAGYRIILRPEPLNGNLISADIFLLNSEGRRVKQVGHADVARSAAGSSSETFQSDASSPFSFSLSHSGERQWTLTQALLFGGDSLTNLNLRCRNLE